ncbi:MAG TPA: LysR family transcriptional regulator [Friedmanniella sp.]
MELPIRWVATFVAVVEQGHFGRAAQALHLSPSAVSKHVQGLERELGSVLLVRQPGAAVEPTPAGLQLVVAAEALLDAHAEAIASVGSVDEPRAVRLGVLAGVPFSRRQVDFVRAAVALRTPGWHLTLRRVGFTSTSQSLLDRFVDVLWTGQAPRHPQIAAIHIGELERVGLVGRGHALAGAGSVSGEVFAEQPLLHNPAVPGEWMEPFRLEDVRPVGEGRLIPIEAEDYGAVIRQVQRGAGAAVTVGPLPPALERTVFTVRLAGLAPMATHAAFRRKDGREVVRTLVEALTDLRMTTPAPA